MADCLALTPISRPPEPGRMPGGNWRPLLMRVSALGTRSKFHIVLNWMDIKVRAV